MRCENTTLTVQTEVLRKVCRDWTHNQLALWWVTQLMIDVCGFYTSKGSNKFQKGKKKSFNFTIV